MGQLCAEYIATLNQCSDEKELSLEFKVLIRKKERVKYVRNISELSLEFKILIKKRERVKYVQNIPTQGL